MQTRRKIPAGREAFTLIEVALAATVLLFAIVSSFQIIAAGTRMLDFSRKQTIAAQIIHAEIDQAHLQDWATMSTIRSSYSDVTVTLNSITSTNTWASGSLGYPELNTFKTMVSQETTTGASTAFTVERVVTYVTGRTDMMKIVFTVSWKAKVWSEKNGTGHTYTRQGTTYFGKNGLSATYQRS